MPRSEYNPQKFKKAVDKGIMASSPHQLWKYNPKDPTIRPIIIRMALSIFPTFFFMSMAFFLVYS